MSNVSMTNLVSAIRGFENLGDTAVVTAGLGGHTISVDNSPQAGVQAAILRNALDMIRETEGLGERGASFVESCFGNITAGGEPITGREVAAVLTAAVHALQTELSFPAGEKTLEEFAAYVQSAPLHELKEADLPQNLAAVNPQQIAAFVERHTVELDVAPPVSSADSQAARDVREAIEDLQNFRNAMGGSPQFGNERPSYEPSTRIILGMPRETWQNYCQAKMDQKSFPQFFWKALGKAFGCEAKPTKYEDVSLQLESLRLLAENRDSLVREFRSDVDAGKTALQLTTRLAGHPELMPASQRAEGMVSSIDGYLELFTALYHDAKGKGNLEQFFNEALHGCCMPDRLTKLQNYAQNHPVGGEDTVYDAGHDINDTVEYALGKEVGALSARIGDDNLTWENISEHLVNIMVGEERRGEGGERVTITEAMIRSDEMREYLNNLLFFE
ncbi:MAG: hypothetical protein FWG17_07835 [Desulfovibrionaceae bacterium]|nr:hypothetical protein [Desulfovibrionaceae bacterium]